MLEISPMLVPSPSAPAHFPRLHYPNHHFRQSSHIALDSTSEPDGTASLYPASKVLETTVMCGPCTSGHNFAASVVLSRPAASNNARQGRAKTAGKF